MKKQLLSSILVGTFILVGCEQPLTSEEVVSEVQTNTESVENYQALINLSVSVTDLETGDVLQENSSDSDIVMNEKTLDNFGKITTISDSSSIVQEYYSVGDKAYLKLDDQEWMDLSTQQETLFQNTDTAYPNLVPIVEAISQAGEMTVEEDSYVYTFQGINDELYAAFEPPYFISFGNLPTSEVEQDVMVTIDKETLMIEELSNQLSGSQNGQELVITIHQEYDNMNEMNDISIPQEVIDAVTTPE